MDVVGVVKLIHVFLLATIKYFITFPYALLIGLDTTQAIIAVTIGGISGFFFFYYLSSALIRMIKSRKVVVTSFVDKYFKFDLNRLFGKFKSRSSKSIRTRRLFVKFRNRYGFIGIIIATPILLSIPLGAFLLNRYYSRKKHVFAYMVLSILGWALVFSAIVTILPHPL
ncbi:hypothetical protein [Sunxiuqinia sp. sy24]|uniref:hypothetical protein n=1 Tax=Sunxiuqinia sp. sy24 TaxID=3461495 RepID=UPI0040463C8E